MEVKVGAGLHAWNHAWSFGHSETSWKGKLEDRSQHLWRAEHGWVSSGRCWELHDVLAPLQEQTSQKAWGWQASLGKRRKAKSIEIRRVRIEDRAIHDWIAKANGDAIQARNRECIAFKRSSRATFRADSTLGRVSLPTFFSRTKNESDHQPTASKPQSTIICCV